jgi:hypothetical protein
MMLEAYEHIKREAGFGDEQARHLLDLLREQRVWFHFGDARVAAAQVDGTNHATTKHDRELRAEVAASLATLNKAHDRHVHLGWIPRGLNKVADKAACTNAADIADLTSKQVKFKFQ